MRIPPALVTALNIEGSTLMVFKATACNLDWTWKVRFSHDDITMDETGSDLQPTLDAMAERIVL